MTFLFGILVWFLVGWHGVAWAGAAPEAVAPPALQAMTKAVLEEKSPDQRSALEKFAEQYSDTPDGVLAYLALGYEAFQARRDDEAKRYFQAAS
ncbi:MAG: tetratricopeptide repeat protein, partial [Acidobacteria bacterium]|nr:tetratricopeptide repeat protein [Acidobacteriota bacterium]